MRKLTQYDSAATWYTAILKNSRKSKLPPGYPQPQPPAVWPEENVALLERYLVWLYADNAGRTSIHDYYLPTAGHVLGFHLQHHSKLDISTSSTQALNADFERVMDYFKAKQLCERWLKMGHHALTRFRRFMQEERGYPRLPDALRKPPNIEQYQEGLPDWLVDQLRQYQQIRQANWRETHLQYTIINFWHKHTRLWRWLFAQYEIEKISDIKRAHLFAYIDAQLAAKHSIRSINLELRAFQATLIFLQEREYDVPQALLRQTGLRAPDTLPCFLTDEQVGLLRAEVERCVQEANTQARQRNALLDRAVFYLLWQGGLRTSEVEDLLLENLNLSQKQVVIRGGKGKKDRMVYLTARTCAVIQAYLTQRGSGATDHVFLYRHEPLGKDLVRNRIKAAGKRAGVKVTPHQLRHTYATQLVNAGCKITTIQALMGHKRLSTTLVYTNIHNHTVAEDYYAAMAKVEKRLAVHLPRLPAKKTASNGHSSSVNGNGQVPLLHLVNALQAEPLNENQQALVAELRQRIETITKQPTIIIQRPERFVNEQSVQQPLMVEMMP